MKTSTMQWMIATAALAVAAGSASAQTLNAQIPVYFHVGKAVMTPGPYQVRTDTGSGSEIVYLHNLATHTSVMLASSVRGDVPKSWIEEGSPRLIFECLDNSCALKRMWNGSGDAYTFPTKKGPGPNLEARLTVVTVLATK